MLSRTLSAALSGIDATLVQVEVHGSSGLPAISTVGLPDSAVRESRERVRSAIINSGFTYPQKRITVNLAPAGIRKAGAALDLPVAAAIVAIDEGAVAKPFQDDTLLMGELSLDGSVRPVAGVLSAALEARRSGLSRILVPDGNVGEARVVPGIEVAAVSSLCETVAILNGAPARPLPPGPAAIPDPAEESWPVDMAEVKGQPAARRAMEVAAAGGHNLVLIGPPGAGKTMLARRLPTILPPLSIEDAIEVTRIHGATGRGSGGLVTRRPFRSPHHTASDAALVGGAGGPWGARPGEASLAHHGVLFLDELPEFHRHVLEVLRQPLEDGFVTISRAARTVTFPARFTLIGAMNPCPCGYLSDPARECACTPPQITRYRSRLSGPLLDRIDLQVMVPAVAYKEIASTESVETSPEIRGRVITARRRQAARPGGVACTARIPARALKDVCPLDGSGRRLMERAVDRLGLSARAHDRVLKVARTIADLEASEAIRTAHLAEAIQYRVLDRE